MDWEEIAKKEGALYCQTKDTWCCYTNSRDGGCRRSSCVNGEEQCIVSGHAVIAAM